MGHDREYSSPVYSCEDCGEPMRAILGSPISDLGIYREVLAWECPNRANHGTTSADVQEADHGN